MHRHAYKGYHTGWLTMLTTDCPPTTYMGCVKLTANDAAIPPQAIDCNSVACLPTGGFVTVAEVLVDMMLVVWDSDDDDIIRFLFLLLVSKHNSLLLFYRNSLASLSLFVFVCMGPFGWLFVSGKDLLPQTSRFYFLVSIHGTSSVRRLGVLTRILHFWRKVYFWPKI